MFPPEQIEELARLCPGVAQAVVGGVPVFLIPTLPLPAGCSPEAVEALLHPTPRDGYPTRLFLAERISTPHGLNWNGNISFAGRSWHAVSWRTPQGLRLAEILMVHLRAFRPEGS